MDRDRSLITRLLRRESGASAAEFALVLPLLVVLLTGAIDIGGLAWTKLQVAAAARAGASYALTRGFNAQGITNAVTDATNLTVTPTVPNTTTLGCPDASSGILPPTTPCPAGGNPGTYVTVGASANYNMLFSWPGLQNPVVLESEAWVRVP